MMSDIEKDRLRAFINNMSAEEAKFLISLIDSKLMINEIKRREALQSDQLSAIKLIMSGK